MTQDELKIELCK